MSDFLDALETRDPAVREAMLMSLLPAQVAHAKKASLAMAQILADVDAPMIASRSALATLPVTRKSELLERQKAIRAEALSRGEQPDAFGGFATIRYGKAMPRLYASPGPLFEPEGMAPNYWRAARALHAAGFRAGDLVHNAFSYHMTPGAFLMESGAHAIGCTVFPAGTGQTELQLEAIGELQPVAYTGTPSFLRILLEKATEAGNPARSFKKALVSGEACPPSLTAWFGEQGVDVYQCYATADVGMIAYETTAREGLVLDEHIIVEIVRPGTGDPVPDGEVGEVVVTVLNPDYPLIRFGTGDLSAVLPGCCPTGRTATRIKGWMGRADQTTKVRGMFVHPAQVADIVRRCPEVNRARLVVTGEMANDQLTLKVEATQIDQAALCNRLAELIRDVTKLRGEVEVLAPGSLPNDGKVIEDARSYQ
ncbi:MAG: AMP-binding protein [Lautropia sp.]|nr:AMP-binding protein [Lautropia sp.]